METITTYEQWEQSLMSRQIQANKLLIAETLSAEQKYGNIIASFNLVRGPDSLQPFYETVLIEEKEKYLELYEKTGQIFDEILERSF